MSNLLLNIWLSNIITTEPEYLVEILSIIKARRKPYRCNGPVAPSVNLSEGSERTSTLPSEVRSTNHLVSTTQGTQQPGMTSHQPRTSTDPQAQESLEPMFPSFPASLPFLSNEPAEFPDHIGHFSYVFRAVPACPPYQAPCHLLRPSHVNGNITKNRKCLDFRQGGPVGSP